MAKLYLGSREITPIKKVEVKAFNVDGYDWLGEVNAQGKLVESTKDINLIFNGVKSIGYMESFMRDTRVKSVNFPDLEEVIGEDILRLFCYRASNLTSISFPELEIINGDEAFYGAFNSDDLRTISFPKLKKALGYGVLTMAFSGNTQLTSAYFPELEEIGYPDGPDAEVMSSLSNCDLLEIVSFPKLKIIWTTGFNEMFASDINLETVELPSLILVKNAGLSGAFYRSGIKTMTFPELTTISNDYAFAACYRECEYLETLYFPKLTTIEIDTTYPSSTPFPNMLEGCSDVIVHFNAGFEDVIGDTTDVLAGFGGTNTTILFDLNGCYVDINVIGTSDYDIYVGGKLKTNPFITGSTSKEYVVYDETNGKLYFGMLENLIVDETNYFTVDFTQLTNKVSLDVGQSGLNVTITYNGITYPTTDEGNGNYSFYTNADNKTFTVSVPETATTRAYSGDVTIESGVNTYTITLTPKAWETFTRPNIYSDGTIGGDSFAVTSSGTYSTSSNYQAYRAVDGNTSTSYYWYSTNITNPTYTFYNPNELKLASLSFRWTSTSYRASAVVVDGSNDGSSWTSIGTYQLDNATTATATINSTTPYKYFRLTFTKGGTYIRLVELTMVATEYK